MSSYKKMGEVCVCPECGFIYVSHDPFECENEDCKKYGVKGIMCDVVTKED